MLLLDTVSVSTHVDTRMACRLLSLADSRTGTARAGNRWPFRWLRPRYTRCLTCRARHGPCDKFICFQAFASLSPLFQKVQRAVSKTVASFHKGNPLDSGQIRQTVRVVAARVAGNSQLSEYRSMKKTLLCASLMGAFAASAHAQSSVTLYGLIDAGMTYSSN